MEDYFSHCKNKIFSVVKVKMTETLVKQIKNLFHLAPKDCKGFSEEQLLEAEKQLAVKFPQVFREYYLQLGATESVNQSFNSLATPEQLYFDGDFLYFWVWWGCHRGLSLVLSTHFLYCLWWLENSRRCILRDDVVLLVRNLGFQESI